MHHITARQPNDQARLQPKFGANMTQSDIATKSVQPAYDVSIIIPVFNRAAFTLRCLQTLAQNSDGPSYEVIIVDNASTDGTAALLAGLGGDVTVISNQHNLGFAKACNQGAQAARSGNLLFLNNDTEPQAGWLPPLLEVLARERRAAVVGARLIYPHGNRVQHAGVAFRPNGAPYHIFQGLDAEHPVVNTPERFQAVTGACLLIRAEAFFAAGMFDEAFVNGFEDIDLCLKVGRMGWTIHYEPRGKVLHHEGISPGRKAHDVPNMLLFMERWAGVVEPDENRHYAKLGLRLSYNDDFTRCTIHHLLDPSRTRTISLDQGGRADERPGV